MAIWWILGVLLLLIAALLCLRVGAEISFGSALRVAVRIGPVRCTVLPRPEKAKAEEQSPKQPQKKKKSGKKPAEKPEKEPLKPTLDEVKEAFPTLFAALKRALGKTRHRLWIDPLKVSVFFGGDDPVALTQAYGWANSVVWTAMPQLERLVHIPDPHIHLEPDFQRPATEAEGTLGLRFRIIDLVNIGLTAGVPALRWYLGLAKKRAAKAAKPAQTA